MYNMSFTRNLDFRLPGEIIIPSAGFEHTITWHGRESGRPDQRTSAAWLMNLLRVSQSVLARYQAIHQLQIARIQAQCAVDPDLHDVQQF